MAYGMVEGLHNIQLSTKAQRGIFTRLPNIVSILLFLYSSLIHVGIFTFVW